MEKKLKGRRSFGIHGRYGTGRDGTKETYAEQKVFACHKNDQINSELLLITNGIVHARRISSINWEIGRLE
jgi:hypothetical protein